MYIFHSEDIWLISGHWESRGSRGIAREKRPEYWAAALRQLILTVTLKVLVFILHFCNIKKRSSASQWHCHTLLFRLQAYLALLGSVFSCFADHFSLNKSTICGNPVWQPCVEHTYRCHFPNSICLLCVSMSHFAGSCNISSLSLLLCLLWWYVINDLWYYYCNWGQNEPRTYKTANFIDKCYVCSVCFTVWPLNCLSPSSWASLFSETQQY